MSEPSVRNGDILAGKYRVERVLGAGGMGYVVAARHLQLDQLVAMKFLRKGSVDNAEAMARFLREAKAVVKLRNEHVAKVFDVGTLESGEPYIVMEHLDGRDLAEVAKERHVLPASEVADYVLQACEGLAEAHALGVVHRDIKLANLFVSRGPAGTPLVKVLDFGISKTNPFGESELDMTRTSSMLGSPRFMSPEQMRDPRAVDGRTDIWSLGVVIYRLVSGRPPFEADTLGRLLTMVMHEQEAPLGSIRRDIPEGFEAVVSRCLEKEPAKRFANVAELAYALVPFCTDQALARATADRIGAVQNLAPAPVDEVPIPVSFGNTTGSRHDVSDLVNADAGTAAPWVGTHGSGKSRKKSSPPLMTLGMSVLFFVLLGGAVLWAHSRNEAANAATPTLPAPTTGEDRSPPPVHTLPSTPLATPSMIAAQPPGPGFVPPGAEAPPIVLQPSAVPVVPAQPPPRHDPPRRAAPAPTPRPKAQPKSAPRPEPAPKPASDDGIPSSRD